MRIKPFNLGKCSPVLGDAGFTLIEVLVAVVILASSILGLVALQSKALQNNQGAYYRSQATILAYDLTDRIRANKNAASDYEYSTSNQPVGTSTLADTDVTEWIGKVETIFPGGSAVSWAVNVTTQSAAGGLASYEEVEIILQWDDDRDGTVTASDSSFSTRFIP